nr:RVT_2 domain-containing protein [Tanacetum cinerariifolium]
EFSVSSVRKVIDERCLPVVSIQTRWSKDVPIKINVHAWKVKQKKDGIFISHDKYVAKILKKFGLTEGKSASTPIHTEKPLLKDPDGEDVDVHIYRSMI